MPEGTIKKLVSDRGFGFILPAEAGAADRGKDLFSHRADIQGNGYDALREGQRISYDVGTDERRGTAKAVNVRTA